MAKERERQIQYTYCVQREIEREEILRDRDTEVSKGMGRDRERGRETERDRQRERDGGREIERWRSSEGRKERYRGEGLLEDEKRGCSECSEQGKLQGRHNRQAHSIYMRLEPVAN